MDFIITSRTFLPVSNQLDQGKDGEMSRLLSAALVDRQFCDLLLNKPALALAKGYNGESFLLSNRDRQFVLASKSASITDFAKGWVNYNNCCSV
jgi:hypothetical protein